jgi:hypothetical protein
MRLNTTQRVIILAGIAIIALMGLFPPWTYTLKATMTYSEEPAGYGFIASPPRRKGDSLMHGVKIDSSRLLIQWTVTIAASCFGVLVTAKRKDKQNS